MAHKLQLMKRERFGSLCYKLPMRSRSFALLLMPLACAAQVDNDTVETEKIRRDLRLALETHFKASDMYVLPKGTVVPGESYVIRKSDDNAKLIFESTNGRQSGVVSPALVTAQQVMAPQAALGASVASGTSTPPWVGLLLKRLDDIDSRVKRLETTGNGK